MGVLASRLYYSVWTGKSRSPPSQESTKLLEQQESEGELPEIPDEHDPKTTQTVLDDMLRVAVLNHNYDIARVLREKGASRATLSYEESKFLFTRKRSIRCSLTTLDKLNMQRIKELFSPDCERYILFDYLNAVLDYIIHGNCPIYDIRRETDRPNRIAECAKEIGEATVDEAFMVFVRWNPLHSLLSSDTRSILFTDYMREKIRHIEAMLEAGADVNVNEGDALSVTSRLPGHTGVLLRLLNCPGVKTNTRNFRDAFETVVKSSDTCTEIVRRFTDLMLNEDDVVWCDASR